jgi:uroporphyrinogen-III synthase
VKQILAGRTVLVTRPAEQASPLVRELEGRGARVLVAPTIRLVPARSAALTAALRDLAAGRFAWIVLTSQRTVQVLRDRIASPGGVRAKVAAIGDGTAAAFRDWTGRDPDLQPSTFTTKALASAFPRGEGRVLCARADIAPEGLEESLSAKGWEPLRVVAYRTQLATSFPREVRRALMWDEIDAVTFTSASTVRGFVNALGLRFGRFRIVCIGPVTSREARKRLGAVHGVAKPHTIEGLVDAVERSLRRGRPRGIVDRT